MEEKNQIYIPEIYIYQLIKYEPTEMLSKFEGIYLRKPSNIL